MVNLTRLFEPIRVGTMMLKNRIVMLAISTNFASVNGAVTERIIDFYRERASGGAGLIIVEGRVDSLLGKSIPCGICVDDDKFIPGLNELAETIKDHGAKVALQLSHAGRRARVTSMITTLRTMSPTVIETRPRQPVSASEIPSVTPGVKTRSLTIKEIQALVDVYAEEANRAKVAGFDAVEVHAGTGHLLANFLSPLTNKRTDEYGRDLDGRMKFPLEIIERIREKLGGSCPITFKFSADEYVEGGLTLEETKVIAEELEKAGANALNVHVATYESSHLTVAPMCVPRGSAVRYAEAIKSVVNIPVIATNRINDPVLAEQIIRNGKADLIGMARALIADPELPNKAAEGRLEDIRKCIACNECIDRLYYCLGITCKINVAAGREKKFELRAAQRPKRILVVGGGPAGMETARVASLRGHEVILCEKEEKLGGQLNKAIIAPHKQEVENLLNYLVYQTKKLELRCELGKEITVESVERMKPEVVVVATGGTPLIPNIPGADKDNVVTSWDVLMGKKEVGERVVVVGGGMVGCETAEYLAEKGKTVTIVEMLEDIAIDVEPRSKWLLVERFKKYGIKSLTEAKAEAITNKGIIVINKDGKKQIIEGDNMVLALGSTPDRKLGEALMGKVKELYMIGDCSKPRTITEAIYEGSLVAREI